jgi:hypothetical protein
MSEERGNLGNINAGVFTDKPFRHPIAPAGVEGEQIHLAANPATLKAAIKRFRLFLRLMTNRLLQAGHC